MHSATTTSLRFLFFPVCRSDALFVSTDLLLCVTFEHFSFEVLLRLLGFVSQGAIVDFDLLTCGCGTPSFGLGFSTGGRAHSPLAPWLSSFSRPVLGYVYVFWPLLPSGRAASPSIFSPAEFMVVSVISVWIFVAQSWLVCGAPTCPLARLRLSSWILSTLPGSRLAQGGFSERRRVWPPLVEHCLQLFALLAGSARLISRILCTL